MKRWALSHRIRKSLPPVYFTWSVVRVDAVAVFVLHTITRKVSGTATFVLCVMAALPLAATAGQSPWYRHALIGMEVGPTGAQWGSDPRDTGYAAQFDGGVIAKKLASIHSDYLVIWGKDGEWAYYDSKFAPKCPGLGDRDVIREAVAAAKPRGIPVIVYCVVQAGGYVLRDHPEWRMVDSQGNTIERICLNSGIRDHIKALTAEMLEYGIDGFHIDMIDQGFGPPYGCWCDDYCKPRFEAKYGHPMPSGVTWDANWDDMMQFRYDTSADFERDIRDHIKSINPGASVDFNYHGYPPFSWEVGQRPVQHAHIGDFVTCESGVWGFSALGAGLTAEFVHATDPEQVFQVVMQRGVRFYHDQTTRPLNDLRWEMFALLSHNAQVTIVDKTPYSGVLDPIAYGRIEQVFKEVQAKREHFGQPLVYEAGLYYSVRSRDWYGREEPTKYIQPFFGAHKALTYAHIPAGSVLDENVDLPALRTFPVVVLPNVAIVSDEELALLREYVGDGGKLIVTGLTGHYDQMGNLLDSPPILELCGARLKERLSDNDNYMQLPKAPKELAALAQDIPNDWPLLVYGPAVVLEPTTATAYGQLVRPVRRTRQIEGKEGTTFPSSADRPCGPAILINHVGKGTVLTLAVSPDAATASEYRTAEARKLLSNAVRYMNPDPEVEITAPLNVETTVSDDHGEGTLRVHLVGYLTPPSTTSPKRPWVIPELVEDTPRYRAEIQVRRPFERVTALSPETALKVDGQHISLDVHDIHEVVCIRY